MIHGVLKIHSWRSLVRNIPTLIILWKVRKSTNMGKFKNPLRNRNVIFVIVITTFTGLQLTVGLAWNNITHHRYVIYKEPQNYWEIKSHTALWTMYMWIFGLVVIIQSFFGVKLSQRQVNLSAETLELNQKHISPIFQNDCLRWRAQGDFFFQDFLLDSAR